MLRLTIGQRLSAGFAVTAVFLLGLSWVSHSTTSTLLHNDHRVAHTHQVLKAVETVLSTLKDGETGQRGYLVTGEDRYLAPYTAAQSRVRDEIGHVAELTSDNAEQQKRIAQLRPLVDDKFAEMQSTIDLRRAKGFEAARGVVLTDAGKAVMDEIRALTGAMTQEEVDLLAVREAASEASGALAKKVAIFGTLLGLVLLAAIATVLSRSVVRPIRQLSDRLEDLAEGEGDLTVRMDDSRPDELGVLSGNFNRFVSKVADTIREIGRTTGTLDAASDQLTGTSQLIAASADEAAAQAGVVASAAAEVSSNVQTAAAGSEEMGASIREIAHNANEAARVAGEAVGVADATNATGEQARRLVPSDR